MFSRPKIASACSLAKTCLVAGIAVSMCEAISLHELMAQKPVESLTQTSMNLAQLAASIETFLKAQEADPIAEMDAA